MIESTDIIGNLIKLHKSELKKMQNYQVLIGFSGFGNVGYLALTHFVETLELTSIAFWGNSSWYHRGNLESVLTVYKHEPSKTIFVLTRMPLHVSTVPQKFWDQLSMDLLRWNARRYIMVGGLREETRRFGSTDWAAFAPTPAWTEKFGDHRSFGDNLAMIGPLSYMLINGTALNIPVLGLLAYCNFDEDKDAAFFAVKKIDELCGLHGTHNDFLAEFDYNFIPGGHLANVFEDDEEEAQDIDDDDDDMPGYDLSDLV
ncbi:MAG: PAC2 family protein [Candidatus Kariarchaeaceae archaeon]